MNWWQDGSPVFQRLCGFSQHPWWVAELPCCVRQFDEQSDTCLVMRAENRNVNTACPDLISKFSKSVMEGIPVAWMSPNLWYLLHPGIWYGYFRFLQSGLSSQKLDAIGSIGAREISNWYATWVISVNFPQTSQTILVHSVLRRGRDIISAAEAGDRTVWRHIYHALFVWFVAGVAINCCTLFFFSSVSKCFVDLCQMCQRSSMKIAKIMRSSETYSTKQVPSESIWRELAAQGWGAWSFQCISARVVLNIFYPIRLIKAVSIRTASERTLKWTDPPPNQDF